MSLEYDSQLMLASEVSSNLGGGWLEFRQCSIQSSAPTAGCGVMTRVRPRPFSWPADPSKAFSASASTTILTTDDVSRRLAIPRTNSAVSGCARNARADRERLAFQQQIEARSERSQ